MNEALDHLLRLSHELGDPARDLAILGEGDTSCRVDDETFLIKASGASLATLGEADVVRCRFAPLLALLDREDAADEEVARTLMDSLVDGSDKSDKRPSVEAVVHAYLLTQAGVSYVAHAHPTSVNGILCSPRAADFAGGRLFPDEVVCCGRSSALVPYADPGLPLAAAIRQRVTRFEELQGERPRVVLLQNHGAVTVGPTADAALASMLMLEKAARIFYYAADNGGPSFLSREHVDRIENRADEAYRRAQLSLQPSAAKADHPE